MSGTTCDAPALLRRSLRDIRAELAAGHVTSVELTEAAIARAGICQMATNAFARIETEVALVSAQRADALRRQGGGDRALLGIPIVIKDMFHVPGQVSGCGSTLRHSAWAAERSTARARLEEAGAVTIGVTNMTEFAYGPTGQNAVTGDVHNPWNPDHIAGGSSSGTAAAVASGAAFAGLGSDTAGSVRTPAALCGITGMKPTHGRVSRWGAMPLSFELDTVGPLTRDVRDNALMLSVLAGHDRRDAATLLGPSSFSDPFDEAAAACTDLSGLRVGLPLGYFDRDLPEHEACLLKVAAKMLRDIGAELVAVPMPEDLDSWNSAGNILVWGDAFALHAADMAESSGLSPQTRGRLELSLALSARDYIDARRARGPALRRFSAEVFGQCDVLLTSTIGLPTPRFADVDVAGGSRMMTTLDALTRLTRPANYLGLPALSIPVGLSRNGLPFAMQIIAPPWHEARLYRVGDAWQGITDWHRRMPDMEGDRG